MRPERLFGGTGEPLWAFAGIEAAGTLRHWRTGRRGIFCRGCHGEACHGEANVWPDGRSACPPMLGYSPTANSDDALGAIMIAGETPVRTRMAVVRSLGLALPMGTKVWRQRFGDPHCGVAIAKEIRNVKDARFVRLCPRFCRRPCSRRDHDNQRTIDRTLGRDQSFIFALDGHWLASDIFKANVFDPSEHKIGDVANLIIDNNGAVTAAIINVGGFLGVGQKDVVIPFKELKVSTRNGKDWLVLDRTKDELKMAPAYIAPKTN